MGKSHLSSDLISGFLLESMIKRLYKKIRTNVLIRRMNMKIIHTADWHLGKILNGKQLLEDQKYVLTQFVNQMKVEKPDVIVIAGDLYDTSYPSKETMGLLEDTRN